MLRALSGILLIALGSPVLAQVYKAVDKYGNVVFSDKPSANAEEVYVAPVQTYSMPAAKVSGSAKLAAPGAPAAKPASATPKALVRYRISIASPAHDSTVRQNEGNLAVGVKVQPYLRDSAKVQFLLDGKPVAKPARSTSIVIPFVDRGMHTIGARVVNASGETRARAQLVTVHMKRFFVQR